jgi:hypothetical protein
MKTKKIKDRLNGSFLTKGSAKNNLVSYRAQFYVRFGRSDRAEP